MPMNEVRQQMRDEEQDRREDIVKTVLRHKRLSVTAIAAKLQDRYGQVGEIADGDELYPSETTWYFTAPKRS